MDGAAHLHTFQPLYSGRLQVALNFCFALLLFIFYFHMFQACSFLFFAAIVGYLRKYAVWRALKAILVTGFKIRVCSVRVVVDST